ILSWSNMRDRIPKQLWALVFFATSSLFSMYQGNPVLPELIDEGLFIPNEFFLGVRAGYQFDDVFDRRMSNQAGSFRLLANQGVLTLNFFDHAEIWGSSGAATFHFSKNVRGVPGVGKVKYKAHNEWIFGTGGRAVLFSWGNVTLGASGSY